MCEALSQRMRQSAHELIEARVLLEKHSRIRQIRAVLMSALEALKSP